MGFESAVVNVGNQSGIFILILGFLTGGWAVIIAGLVAGKKQQEITECLKWGLICILLTPIFFIG